MPLSGLSLTNLSRSSTQKPLEHPQASTWTTVWQRTGLGGVVACGNGFHEVCSVSREVFTSLHETLGNPLRCTIGRKGTTGDVDCMYHSTPNPVSWFCVIPLSEGAARVSVNPDSPSPRGFVLALRSHLNHRSDSCFHLLCHTAPKGRDRWSRPLWGDPPNRRRWFPPSKPTSFRFDRIRANMFRDLIHPLRRWTTPHFLVSTQAHAVPVC